MDKSVFKNELTDKMNKAMKVLDNELKGLRTGRASVNLLDSVVVESYGNKMSISQLGSVSTPDAKTLVVQVWDKSMAKAVEKGIVEANLGLNPVADGQLIRISIPPMTEDRRKELVKLAHKYAENTKVSCRNIRRDGNDELKKLEKNHEISKDEHHSISEDIQKLTDDFSNKIDTLIKNKEKEILSI